MRFICKLFLIFFLLGSFRISCGEMPKDMVLKAKEVYYDAKSDVVIAKGNIFIQMDKYTLTADQIYYDPKQDIVAAEGNVRIDDKKQIIYGERAVFKDKLKTGIIKEFTAKLENNSIIAASSANRLSDRHFTLEKAVFTPCTINCGKKPIWQINAGKTDINYNTKKVTYRNVLFEVYGVPIIYLPYFTHATPDAPAKSGLLNPRIKRGGFMVPVYFRAKSNLDFTISPRFTDRYTIFEGEARHKVKLGQYKVRGSYGNPAFKKTENGVEKGSRPGRYHIFSDGNFNKDRVNYGFALNRASDKAYLTNYHGIYDLYLTSKFYVNTVNKRDYLSIEGLVFQDLRSYEDKLDENNRRIRTPVVLPAVRTQNVIALNEPESLLLNVRSNTIAYKEEDLQLARMSLGLELMNNSFSNGGHMLTLTASNRADLYWTDRINAPTTNDSTSKSLYRNIPELSARWRYPLMKNLNSRSNIVVEPTAMAVIGEKYESKFKKFQLVDAPKNEFSENNIFKANSFSGIDFHDYGNRFKYGMNAFLGSDLLYINTFLGQAFQKNNVSNKSNANYVGSISTDIGDNFELFYRFRRDRSFTPIRDEIGVNTTSERFVGNTVFTKLNKISRYFTTTGINAENDKAAQLSCDLNYLLLPHLWIGTAARIEFVGSKSNLLTRSIKMTYLFDCVSISGAVTEDFLQDSTRGIKKSRTYNFLVGLKVINM
jgi:LPS-assembly protein